MGIKEEVRDAIKDRDIDQLLGLVKRVTVEDDVDEILRLYEDYYVREVEICKHLHVLLTQMRLRRSKNLIPNSGSYTFKLEK